MVVNQKPTKLIEDLPATQKDVSDKSADLSAKQPSDDFLDKGPENSKGQSGKSRDKKPQRRCIVSREILPADQLIRFVVGPDDIVVPDVNCKLPGRGAWVRANRVDVAEAIKKNIFTRVFKKKVTAKADLADQTADILERFAIGSLAMARASGALAIGFSKIDKMIRASDAWLVLEAKDGANDGKRKIAQACRAVEHLGGEKPQVFELFTAEQMANAIAGNEGGSAMVHLGLSRALNARSCVLKIRRLANYLGVEPVDVTAQNSPNTRQE